MTDIRNNADIARGICSNIKAASAAMKLDNNHVIACEHVRAEEDGDVTYEKGVKLADQLQIQIGHVHDYIAQISETLEKADECVASGSRLEAPAGRSARLLKRGN